MPGIPSIYYGSEWGLEGRKEEGDAALRPTIESPEWNGLTDQIAAMVKARKERFSGAYAKMMIAGIVMCVVSALPIFVTMLVVGDSENGINELYYIYATGVLLLLVALGVFLIVRASIIQGSYQMLLEEGDYTRKNKVENKKNDKITTGYWIIVTAAFLAYSFITSEWHRSWIIWPIAGVLYGLVILIAGTLRDRN